MINSARSKMEPYLLKNITKHMGASRNVHNATQVCSRKHRRNFGPGGGDKMGQITPPQHFFNLGIVFWLLN
jgi:hypothetical protein